MPKAKWPKIDKTKQNQKPKSNKTGKLTWNFWPGIVVKASNLNCFFFLQPKITHIMSKLFLCTQVTKYRISW